MTHSACLLQWATIGDEIWNVSEFAQTSPKERPLALCPVCKQPVIMKLGTQRVHHVAHQPFSDCIVTNPETALHFNIKFYLANQLKRSRSLFIEAPCSSNYMCANTYIVEWLTDWDSIEVEYAIGSCRPDVALLKDGVTIGALEVHITHAVDEGKAEYLKTLNIPWVEIEGTEELYLGENRWIATEPLLVSKHQPSPGKCDYCIELEEQERQRAKEREYRAKNFTGISSLKIVDFYFPSGKKYREVYELYERVEDGQRVEVWLVKRSKKQVLVGAKAPITEEALAAIGLAFDNELRNIEHRTGAVVDSPMKWSAWSSRFENDHVIYREENFPRRYVWWPSECKWFIPKDHRDITWDTD